MKRVQLHKITGLRFCAFGDAAGALAHRWQSIYSSTVRQASKKIETTGAELKPKPEPQPKGPPAPGEDPERDTGKTWTPEKESQLTTECAQVPVWAARRSVRVNHLTLHRRPPPDARGSHDDADYSTKGGSRVR